MGSCLAYCACLLSRLQHEHKYFRNKQFLQTSLSLCSNSALTKFSTLPKICQRYDSLQSVTPRISTSYSIHQSSGHLLFLYAHRFACTHIRVFHMLTLVWSGRLAEQNPASSAQAKICVVMQLTEMKPIEVEGKQRLTFVAPSRGLIGFRSLFATLTRGSGMLHRAFQSYGHYKGPLDKVRKGVLISMAGQSLVNSYTFSAVPCVATATFMSVSPTLGTTQCLLSLSVNCEYNAVACQLDAFYLHSNATLPNMMTCSPSSACSDSSLT